MHIRTRNPHVKNDEIFLQCLVLLTRSRRGGTKTVRGGDRIPTEFGAIVSLDYGTPVDLLTSTCLLKA